MDHGRPSPADGPPTDQGQGGVDALAAALAQQLDALRPFVTGLARRGPAALDADDLLQDVMERALRYRHTHQPGRALLPWLRRTAFRVFLDQRASLTRRPAGVDDLAALPAPGRADRLALVDEVRHLLAGLPAVEREVLLAFHRDGQPIAAIAAARDLPAGTVKSHLHRARRRLAEQHPEGP